MKNISWQISNEEALLNSYRKSNIKDFYVMTYKLPKRIFQAKTRRFFGWLPLYLVIETSKGTPNENNSGLHYYEHDFKFTVKTDFNSDRKILASGFEECLQRIDVGSYDFFASFTNFVGLNTEEKSTLVRLVAKLDPSIEQKRLSQEKDKKRQKEIEEQKRKSELEDNKKRRDEIIETKKTM